MSEIYFVRHGQASLGAKNYDKLSPLGWDQARWLGEHYREQKLSFDNVVVGDMRRHRETLQGISEGMGTSFEVKTDPRFNEFKFFPILRLHQSIYQPDQQLPTTVNELFSMMRVVMEAWIKGSLDDALRQHDEDNGTKTESWDQFNQRVLAGLAEVQSTESGKKTLVVSSGGPKSLAIKHALGLSDDVAIELMMQIRNTSTTRFLSASERISLRAFNVLAHMERPDRQHAITMA
jgi:broad specificity phosphatase PhoE